MEQLTVKEKRGANYVLFEMTGVFNAYTSHVAQNKIYDAIKNNNVVLDLSKIIELDMAAMGIIMAAINDGAETGHSVYLKSLSNEADKQVSATGFKELLKIINSVTEVK